MKNVDAGIDAAKAEIAAEKAAEYAAVRDRVRAAEASRVRFTAQDLAGATHVRTNLGWHRVVRVNGKSVTVKTPYSWTDRVPVEKILEHRTVIS
jgi:hypothetical protein